MLLKRQRRFPCGLVSFAGLHSRFLLLSFFPILIVSFFFLFYFLFAHSPGVILLSKNHFAWIILHRMVQSADPSQINYSACKD